MSKVSRAMAHEQFLLKREAKALKKAKGQPIVLMRVYKFQLADMLNRGWEVLSHTPVSYGAAEKYMLKIDAEVLKERLS